MSRIGFGFTSVIPRGMLWHWDDTIGSSSKKRYKWLPSSNRFSLEKWKQRQREKNGQSWNKKKKNKSHKYKDQEARPSRDLLKNVLKKECASKLSSKFNSLSQNTRTRQNEMKMLSNEIIKIKHRWTEKEFLFWIYINNLLFDYQFRRAIQYVID